jgi:hypothetical protein
MTEEYSPDSRSDPRVTVIDSLEERGIKPSDCQPKLRDYLDDQSKDLTDDIAQELQRLTGIKAGFWIKRNKDYKESYNQI